MKIFSKKELSVLIMLLLVAIVIGCKAGIFDSSAVTDNNTQSSNHSYKVEAALKEKCAVALNVSPNEVSIIPKFYDYHYYVYVDCNDKRYSIYDNTNMDAAGTVTLYYGLEGHDVEKALEIIENYTFKVSGSEITINYDSSYFKSEEAGLTEVYSEALDDLKDLLLTVYKEENYVESVNQSLLKISKSLDGNGRVMNWTIVGQTDTYSSPYTWTYPVYCHDYEEFNELMDAIVSEDSSYEFPLESVECTFEGIYFELDFSNK